MALSLPSVGQILSIVGDAVVDVTVDEAELAAGTSVTLPIDITVGSTGGKPVYAVVQLTTTKPV